MSVTPAVLVRLCAAQDWSLAQALDRIDPDDGEEFVHLSTLAQVHLPANRLYRGRRDLVLLHVDASLLDAPLRWEPGVPTDPESMLFPHLYGSLPLRAVMKTTAYLPAEDGSFAPAEGQEPT
jgi:uncharacterized protein (DUF952 family)